MKIFHICLTSRQKHYFFIFHFIDFDDFLTTFAKNLMKRPPAFMIDIKSLYKLLLSHKDLRSRNIWQWNDGLLNIFKNLYGNAFSLFVFIKRKNRCNVPFNDTYKMCCYHLFKRKLKLYETAFLKQRAIKHGVSFFSFFYF